MGEAKRRRANAGTVVYHHTSTLRTNLIWMSGVIEVEGKSEGVFHPAIGEIRTDVLARRATKDFPPVAWFTNQIAIPQCLVNSEYYGIDKNTGERIEMRLGDKRDVANVLALNRIAIGFPIDKIPVVRWTDYFGYSTPEGRELNESAIEAGDDPANWYVSENPVDVLQSTEIWGSSSILRPKLRRHESYLSVVHQMVRTCRSDKSHFIAPTWMTQSEVEVVARKLGVGVRRGDEA